MGDDEAATDIIQDNNDKNVQQIDSKLNRVPIRPHETDPLSSTHHIK